MSQAVRLICGNCGKEGRFDSWQAAFDANWDTVERFGYNACDECLGVSVYFPMYYASLAREAKTPQERERLLNQAAVATWMYNMDEAPKKAPREE